MISRTLQLITSARLVAVVRLDDLSHAVKLARALLAGGIVAQEFTLTNPDAPHAIGEVLASLPEFQDGRATLGAGSVRSIEEAQAAIEAGAQFLVTPTTIPAVIAGGREAGIPVIAGALTPTEIAGAWEAGAPIVKVFPARTLGPRYLRDVLAPMPYLKLMPTGGIDLSNLGAYLEQGAVAVGVGGKLLDKRVLEARDWREITRTARLYAEAAGG